MSQKVQRRARRLLLSAPAALIVVSATTALLSTGCGSGGNGTHVTPTPTPTPTGTGPTPTPTPTTTGQVTKAIGPTGGTVTVAPVGTAGSYNLSFPANAVTASTTVTVTPVGDSGRTMTFDIAFDEICFDQIRKSGERN